MDDPNLLCGTQTLPSWLMKFAYEGGNSVRFTWIPVQSRHVDTYLETYYHCAVYSLPRFPGDCNDLLRAPAEEKMLSVGYCVCDIGCVMLSV